MPAVRKTKELAEDERIGNAADARAVEGSPGPSTISASRWTTGTTLAASGICHGIKNCLSSMLLEKSANAVPLGAINQKKRARGCEFPRARGKASLKNAYLLF